MEMVIKILMNRDGMTRAEAEDLYEEVMDEVKCYIAKGRYSDAEMAFEDGFGLEPDYIMDCLMNCFI